MFPSSKEIRFPIMMRSTWGNHSTILHHFQKLSSAAIRSRRLFHFWKVIEWHQASWSQNCTRISQGKIVGNTYTSYTERRNLCTSRGWEFCPASVPGLVSIPDSDRAILCCTLSAVRSTFRPSTEGVARHGYILRPDKYPHFDPQKTVSHSFSVNI